MELFERGNSPVGEFDCSFPRYRRADSYRPPRCAKGWDALRLPVHGHVSQGAVWLVELGRPPHSNFVEPPSPETVKALHELVILFGALLGEAYERHACLDVLIKLQSSGPMKAAIYVRQCAIDYRQNASQILRLIEDGIGVTLPLSGRPFVDHVLSGAIGAAYFTESAHDRWG